MKLKKLLLLLLLCDGVVWTKGARRGRVTTGKAHDVDAPYPNVLFAMAWPQSGPSWSWGSPLFAWHGGARHGMACPPELSRPELRERERERDTVLTDTAPSPAPPARAPPARRNARADDACSRCRRETEICPELSESSNRYPWLLNSTSNPTNVFLQTRNLSKNLLRSDKKKGNLSNKTDRI